MGKATYSNVSRKESNGRNEGIYQHEKESALLYVERSCSSMYHPSSGFSELLHEAAYDPSKFVRLLGHDEVSRSGEHLKIGILDVLIEVG